MITADIRRQHRQIPRSTISRDRPVHLERERVGQGWSGASRPPLLSSRSFPAREDPGRLAFELHGIMLAADTRFVLYDDPAALDLARQIVRQRLGIELTEVADSRIS